MQDGILVADDDVMIRGLLRSVLMTSGYDVFVATTGEEALELASRMRAVLVLLDMSMRRGNGLVACERLRAMPGYATTPIVFLTALDNQDARAAAARVGATQFIAKPFKPAGLLAALAPYLDPRRSPTQADRGQADGEQSRTATTPRGHGLERGKSMLEVCRGDAKAADEA